MTEQINLELLPKQESETGKRFNLIGNVEVTRDKQGKLVDVCFNAKVDNKKRTILIAKRHEDNKFVIWRENKNEDKWTDKEIIKEIEEVFNNAIGKKPEEEDLNADKPPRCPRCNIQHPLGDNCKDYEV